MIKIKRIIYEILGDFNSCKNCFLMLEGRASKANIIVFFTVSLIFLGIVLFNSTSEADFYIKLLKSLGVLLLSFFIYTQSNSFWFLIMKFKIYEYNISHKRHMKSLLDRANKTHFEKKGSIQGQILLTALLNERTYIQHAKRYLIEAGIALILFSYIFPVFIFYGIAIFIAVFVYTGLYDKEPGAQAFDDVAYLINAIRALNKENPKECREFILKNKTKEVSDLKKLYLFVLESEKKMHY